MGGCTRKFYDLRHAYASRVFAKAIEWIGQIYSIESGIRRRLLDGRRSIRQAHAWPELNSIRQWLKVNLTEV